MKSIFAISIAFLAFNLGLSQVRFTRQQNSTGTVNFTSVPTQRSTSTPTIRVTATHTPILTEEGSAPLTRPPAPTPVNRVTATGSPIPTAVAGIDVTRPGIIQINTPISTTVSINPTTQPPVNNIVVSPIPTPNPIRNTRNRTQSRRITSAPTLKATTSRPTQSPTPIGSELPNQSNIPTLIQVQVPSLSPKNDNATIDEPESAPAANQNANDDISLDNRILAGIIVCVLVLGLVTLVVICYVKRKDYREKEDIISSYHPSSLRQPSHIIHNESAPQRKTSPSKYSTSDLAPDSNLYSIVSSPPSASLSSYSTTSNMVNYSSSVNSGIQSNTSYVSSFNSTTQNSCVNSIDSRQTSWIKEMPTYDEVDIDLMTPVGPHHSAYESDSDTGRLSASYHF